jgi:hypothetical protein
MSLYQHGITLKSLLEDPNLINTPKFNNDGKNKCAEDSDPKLYQGRTALLGGPLWEKTLPYDDDDFQLEYMDLDEFLEENGIPLGAEGASKQNVQTQPKSPATSDTECIRSVSPLDVCLSGSSSPVRMPTLNHIDHSILSGPSIRQMLAEAPIVSDNHDNSEPRSPEPSELDNEDDDDTDDNQSMDLDVNFNESDVLLAQSPGDKGFDPRKRRFTDDELRPQPMIKKSKKIFVATDDKDDKYWNRRIKNNVAAKRSREARRVKENQIALRASFLERENEKLKLELSLSRKQTEEFRQRLSKYETLASGTN